MALNHRDRYRGCTRWNDLGCSGVAIAFPLPPIPLACGIAQGGWRGGIYGNDVRNDDLLFPRVVHRPVRLEGMAFSASSPFDGRDAFGLLEL